MTQDLRNAHARESIHRLMIVGAACWRKGRQKSRQATHPVAVNSSIEQTCALDMCRIADDYSPVRGADSLQQL
jgi:hypothetical protein